MHLNVSGWTETNSELRQSLILATNSHIISLNETHLKLDDNIVLHGFHWFGNNRKNINVSINVKSTSLEE